MSGEEKRQEGTGRQWDEALSNDYYDYRWHQLLDPLCDTFRSWKAGELTHADVDRAIDDAYKQRCVINDLFAQRKDRAVALIQWWDRDWFEAWVKEHRAPAEMSDGKAS